MNPSLTLIFTAVTLAPSASGEERTHQPMRDAATHDQLVAKMRSVQEKDPMKNLQPVNTPDPTKANPPTHLLSDSDILCFDGRATLVPKHAIINRPINLENRLKYQEGAKILSWLDFYSLNRGWITTMEVTRNQAEGNQPLAKETAEQVRKSLNLVVATYQGGPISVLPPKEAPSAISGTSTNQPDKIKP